MLVVASTSQPNRHLHACIALLTAMVALGAGDVRAARWRLDVGGGAMIPLSANDLPDAPDDSSDTRYDADFADGGSYALGMGYVLTDHVELTGQFQHSLSRDADRLGDLFGRRRVEKLDIRTTDSELDVFSVTAGGRLHLLAPGHRVRPWIIGQLGWYRASAQVLTFTCGRGCRPPLHFIGGLEDGFGINAGGGIDVAVTPTVSVGFDARYHRAFGLLGELQFLTTMAVVSLRF